MGRFSGTSLAAVWTAGPLLLWGGLALVLLSGCGRGTFVGRQYDDFTAYYNTFHNAQQAFEEGREAIQERDRSIDRTRYLPVFPAPSSENNESAFEKAVQKSSDVLRDHPESRWVDDALMLIGKSYFYQGNYVGAAQKFRDVLALEAGRKHEAQFWLARTLVANERLEEAAEMLEGAVDTTKAPENTWTARLHLVQGELLVRQQRWPDAAVSLERGLDGAVPDAVGARAAFLLGQVRETMGQRAEARAAYRRVQEYGASYELEFAARLSEIELQGKQGDATAALERLDDLQTDDKNLDKRGEMALVEARIHRAQGHPDRAQSALKRVLYDSDVSLSQEATRRIHYNLATLYRDDYEDFSQAAAHFDTASTQQGNEAEQGIAQRLPTAPTDAEVQANQYRSLADRADAVTRLDSLLRIGRMSESEFRAFVEEQRRKRRAEREEEAEDASRRRRVRSPGTSSETQRRTAETAADTRTSDAGFLFYKEPSRVQEGRRRFISTWGDRPRVDNWRRRNAMRRDAASDEDDERADAEAPQEGGEVQATTGLDLSAIPRDSSSQAQMETERARARYELGNALFLAAGRPDSAATWYRRVLEEDGEQPVARRAIYGLAEAYWEQGDTAAARQAYEQLVDRYPDSDLAVRARQRLNRQAERVGENQSVQADSGYVRAYRQWNQGAERPALEAFLDVARQYPDTEAAPRALLAAGIIYWRQLQAEPDSGLTSTVTRYLQAVQSDSTQARRRDSLAERRSSPDASADSVGANAPAPADEEEASMARLPAAPADTAVPDSARADTVRPDRPSARNSARVDSATADTTAAASTEGVLRPLGDLLRYLTERYSEAPQRKRADAILALIEGKAPPPDSVSVERIREQTGASEPEPDSSSNPDGPGGRPSAQEASSEADNSPQPTQSGGDDPLPAPTTVQSSGAPEAGWTVLVQAFAAPDAADEQRQILRNKLGGAWRPEVIQDPAADSEYLLVVGTFDTEEEAQVVQSQLQEKLNRRLDVRQRPGEAETP